MVSVSQRPCICFIPRILLLFKVAIPHCSETFISAIFFTPKSFSFIVITVSPISKFTSKFPCYVCRYLHFPKFNNICYFSDDLTNLSRSFCKCCLSPSLLNFLNIFVSSANFSTLLVILSSMSLIYIKNNKGHNTDPCGTPLKNRFPIWNFHISYNTLSSVSQPFFYPVDYDIPNTMDF